MSLRGPNSRAMMEPTLANSMAGAGRCPLVMYSRPRGWSTSSWVMERMMDNLSMWRATRGRISEIWIPGTLVPMGLKPLLGFGSRCPPGWASFQQEQDTGLSPSGGGLAARSSHQDPFISRYWLKWNPHQAQRPKPQKVPASQTFTETVASPSIHDRDSPYQRLFKNCSEATRAQSRSSIASRLESPRRIMAFSPACSDTVGNGTRPPDTVLQ